MKPDRRSPSRLLVEGNDDLHSIVHLMMRHGFDLEAKRVFVEAMGGVDDVGRAVAGINEALARESTIERLGIVIDADHSAEAAWDSVVNRLKKHFGADPPPSPPPAGWIGPARTLTVGVWIMPDNTTTGTLETFLNQLVPPDDLCRAFATQCALAARIAHSAPYAQKDTLKAELHTWLAWQAKPGQPFGQAINARVLAADSPTAGPFVTWFRTLFDPQHPA